MFSIVMSDPCVISAATIGKAAEDGSPGRVEISLDRKPDMLAIDVAHDGIGLPAGFDPSDAKGLGLTIVRTFVEVELGGTIRLRSGAEGGTVAEVRIPASRLVSPLDDARDPRA